MGQIGWVRAAGGFGFIIRLGGSLKVAFAARISIINSASLEREKSMSVDVWNETGSTFMSS